VFAPWTKAQQTFWERWRAAMANGATQAGSPLSAWSLPIEFWRAAIYGSLDIQLATVEACKAWVCANDANIPEITGGACEVAHFVEDWTHSQIRVWEGWFAALESLAPLVASRETRPADPAAKPRLHLRARPHGAHTHEQPHNGVPA